MSEKDIKNIKLQSPCIGVCSQNPETKTCYGCQRTLDEIDGWDNLSDEEKIALFDELEKRRDELFGD